MVWTNLSNEVGVVHRASDQENDSMSGYNEQHTVKLDSDNAVEIQLRRGPFHELRQIRSDRKRLNDSQSHRSCNQKSQELSLIKVNNVVLRGKLITYCPCSTDCVCWSAHRRLLRTQGPTQQSRSKLCKNHQNNYFCRKDIVVKRNFQEAKLLDFLN